MTCRSSWSAATHARQQGIAELLPGMQTGHATRVVRQRARTSRISSVVSESVARVLPCASSGSRPRVIRHCRAGCSPLQVQVSESVVSTGTATVSTGMAGRYLATQPRGRAAARQHHYQRRMHLQAGDHAVRSRPCMISAVAAQKHARGHCKPAWRRGLCDTLCAVRTADEASDSSGDMGTTARFMMALNSE